MIYLGNINHKNEKTSSNKPIILPDCDFEGHEAYNLNIICVDKECFQKGLICIMCHYEFHRQHKTIPAKIFIDKYRDSYNEFQSSSKLNEFKLDQAKETYLKILNKQKELHQKMLKDNNDILKCIENYSEQEINLLYQQLNSQKDIYLDFLSEQKDVKTENSKFNFSKMIERIDFDNLDQQNDEISFKHEKKFEVVSKSFFELKNQLEKIKKNLFEKFQEENSALEDLLKTIEHTVVEEKFKVDCNNLDGRINLELIDEMKIGKNNILTMINMKNSEERIFLIFQGNNFIVKNLADKQGQKILSNVNQNLKKIFYLSKTNFIVCLDEKNGLYFYKLTVLDKFYDMRFIEKISEFVNAENIRVVGDYIIICWKEKIQFLSFLEQDSKLKWVLVGEFDVNFLNIEISNRNDCLAFLNKNGNVVIFNLESNSFEIKEDLLFKNKTFSLFYDFKMKDYIALEYEDFKKEILLTVHLEKEGLTKSYIIQKDIEDINEENIHLIIHISLEEIIIIQEGYLKLIKNV